MSLDRPPRVGITTYREPARWGVWDQRADLLPATYADAVVAAGGVAMLLPPGGPAEHAQAALEAVDGIVLAGGADLDPARYGQNAGPQTGAPRADRDAWEFAVLHAALSRDLPVLAVCRGIQVLNVALGGTLHQHVPDVVGHDAHCPTPGAFGRHNVTVTGGRLAGIMGGGGEVATYHHQAIDALGDGLIATARADDDLVEGVELAGATWVLGVQWHPEAHEGRPLFAAFVAACSRDGDAADAGSSRERVHERGTAR